MAVTLGKSPIICTAAGDVSTMRIKAPTFWLANKTNAGRVLVKDKNGGRAIFDAYAAANENIELHMTGDCTVLDGFYVDTLPTDAILYIYYS